MGYAVLFLFRPSRQGSWISAFLCLNPSYCSFAILHIRAASFWDSGQCRETGRRYVSLSSVHYMHFELQQHS